MQIRPVTTPVVCFSLLEKWHVIDRQYVKIDDPLCTLSSYPDNYTSLTITAHVAGYFYIFKPIQSILAGNDVLGIISDVPEWSERYRKPLAP